MLTKKLGNQNGQVLLMLILISSVLLTVGLSMSQVNVNETKITKLEEEAKKSSQAAEAGIEKTIDEIKTNPLTTQITIMPDRLNGVKVQTEVTKTNDKNGGTQFKTPVLKKDEQFTFYLAKYDSTAGSWSEPFNGNLTFYLNSNKKVNCGSGRDVPAVELTYIYTNPSTAEKYIIDPCGTFTTPANKILTTIDNSNATMSEFAKRTNTVFDIDSSKAPKIIVARVLYGDTMLGFESPSQLKEQGKIITSTADSSTNVTKKIELFQSLPQIPADFFVTSF